MEMIRDIYQSHRVTIVLDMHGFSGLQTGPRVDVIGACIPLLPTSDLYYLRCRIINLGWIVTQQQQLFELCSSL